MKDIFLSNFLIFCSILCGITSSKITIYKEESIYEHVGRKGTILLSFKDNDYFNSLEIINKNVLVKDTLENIENKSLKYQEIVDYGKKKTNHYIISVILMKQYPKENIICFLLKISNSTMMIST